MPELDYTAPYLHTRNKLQNYHLEIGSIHPTRLSEYLRAEQETISEELELLTRRLVDNDHDILSF